MTCMVDARSLWHDADGWAKPLLLGTIDGAQYISDRYILLPVSRIGGLPVGWGSLLTPLSGQAEDALAEWLTAGVLPDPSARVFAVDIIGPLEAAGFRLRPLEGVKDAHGICDPDLQLVGLATPLRRRMEADAAAGTTRTART